jgi:4-diphosphocytidyl-2-C-methyl-D-erythritol kinase
MGGEIMRTVKEKAYAKINLYLDVCSRRDDGFHEIESIMQSISLADELTFTLAPGEKRSVSLKILGNDALQNDESNLVLHAVKAFEEYRPIEGRLDITLKKQIPTEAGLGGGSADAAATLRALNRLADEPIDDIELYNIATGLGSDVPFCLRGGTHICHGRGELLSHTKALKNLHILIVNSGEKVSTPKAYGELDRMYDNFKVERCDDGRKAAFESIKAGKCYKLYNVFEEAVLPHCPKAKSAKERLISLGARAALMSGSGATVFGIFESKDAALSAKEDLASEFEFVCYAEEN